MVARKETSAGSNMVCAERRPVCQAAAARFQTLRNWICQSVVMSVLTSIRWALRAGAGAAVGLRGFAFADDAEADVIGDVFGGVEGAGASAEAGGAAFPGAAAVDALRPMGRASRVDAIGAAV